MGRTQSAIAILTTVLQVLMSFSLGWLAQRVSLYAGFALLTAMYAVATLCASRAKRLLSGLTA